MDKQENIQIGQATSESFIFGDVFKRADKDDDGQISLEHFKTFFADGVISDDELEKLFHEIDTHNTNVIDTGELHCFFAKHLGNFKDVFADVEQINKDVTTALELISKSYSSAPAMSQFISRFLLKESHYQLAGMIQHLDTALEHLDEETRQQRPPLKVEIPPVLPSGDATPGRVTPGRMKRREKRALLNSQSSQNDSVVSSPFSFLSPVTNDLKLQIDRLQALVDKLQNQVKMSNIKDEVLDITNEDNLLLVNQKYSVNEVSRTDFKERLRTYVMGASANKNCRHITVRSYQNSNLISVYELWASEEHWNDFVKGDLNTEFKDFCKQFLDAPVEVNHMCVPASWFENCFITE